jgi:glutaryl-CoA dehydrogenase
MCGDNAAGSAHHLRITPVTPSIGPVRSTVRMRETVGWARELLGGNGILLDHRVGRFVADAEALYSYEGTREMHTLIVGRSITGISAFV